MNVDQKILSRLDQMIVFGEGILKTQRQMPSNFVGFDDRVDSDLANQWFTSSQSLLKRAFGEDSVHFKNFTANGEQLTYSPVFRGIGILRAAKDDYEGGYLFDLRQVIEAEVFDDFLEQSEHLLKNGYYQPAAVIAGATLEDGLRKLCGRHNVTLPDKPKLDTMNADLAKLGAYNKLAQKQVTVWADLRNKAAHGQWNEFTEADVKNMLDGVRNFMANHFT